VNSPFPCKKCERSVYKAVHANIEKRNTRHFKEGSHSNFNSWSPVSLNEEKLSNQTYCSKAPEKSIIGTHSPLVWGLKHHQRYHDCDILSACFIYLFIFLLGSELGLRD